MSKKNNTPLNLFMEAVGLYFSNFGKFMKYMTFPVLGQIIGLLLVFIITYFYTQYMPPLMENFPALNNFNVLILISIIITLPGLAIFCKAFWEYLVAYGAINSMCDNMQKSGKVYDFDAHTELIKRRTWPFICLWLLFSIFYFIALCPLFWVVCGILTVYFILIFQVFTFEPELSPVACVKRSLEIIKGHFFSTFTLLALVGALTYICIPQIFIKIFDSCGINHFLANAIIPFTSLIPMFSLEQYGINSPSEFDVASFTIHTFLAQIIIQYTLPLRSILWSLWYKECSGKQVERKITSKKRPSEKLMESSHKKYGTKKLDKNILKRASEKDD